MDCATGCLVLLALALLHLTTLRLMGRIWFCAHCPVTITSFWWADSLSGCNSQHLADVYSVTHVTDGFIFYILYQIITWLFDWNYHLFDALALSTLVMTIWEVSENSGLVIHLFRRGIVAGLYYGDTVTNSTGDIWSAVLGTAIAFWMQHWWWSILSILMLEVLVTWWVRDAIWCQAIQLCLPSKSKLLAWLHRWQNNLPARAAIIRKRLAEDPNFKAPPDFDVTLGPIGHDCSISQPLAEPPIPPIPTTPVPAATLQPVAVPYVTPAVLQKPAKKHKYGVPSAAAMDSFDTQHPWEARYLADEHISRQNSRLKATTGNRNRHLTLVNNHL